MKLRFCFRCHARPAPRTNKFSCPQVGIPWKEHFCNECANTFIEWIGGLNGSSPEPPPPGSCCRCHARPAPNVDKLYSDDGGAPLVYLLCNECAKMFMKWTRELHKPSPETLRVIAEMRAKQAAMLAELRPTRTGKGGEGAQSSKLG